MKFDDAAARLNTINHKMSMLDDRVNIKLEKLSNVIDEVDNRLDEMDSGINKKLTTTRLAPNMKPTSTFTITLRPPRKWRRAFLKYWMLTIIITRAVVQTVQNLISVFSELD